MGKSNTKKKDEAVENIVESNIDLTKVDIAEYEDVECPFGGATLRIKQTLSAREMVDMVNAVVDSVFSDEYVYVPEGREFANRCAVIVLYSNCILPDDVVDRYSAVYSHAGEMAFDIIMDNIDQDQYRDIQRAINAKIDYLTHTNIMNVENKINKLFETLDGVSDQIERTFGSLSENDIRGLISSLIQGIDETKLMDAYLESKKESEDTKE